jgi:hypothetical protein
MPNLNFTTTEAIFSTKVVGFDSTNPGAERTYEARSIADTGSLATDSTAGRVPGLGGTGNGNAVTVAQLGVHVQNTNNPHSVTKAQVGLGDVDNTSDADKPVSNATQQSLDQKVSAFNAALEGVPTAPTASPDTNTTQIATTEFAKNEADDAQEFAIQRSNHTGSQAISTVTGLQTALDSKVNGEGVTTILVLTQSAYDAITSPSSTTLYVIAG